MTTYRWNGKTFVDKKTGEEMHLPYEGKVVAPMVQSDTPEYRSPVDGRVISSRSARREDLKRNNCIEIDPPAKPRGYKNPRFAAKHGLPLREDAQT